MLYACTFAASKIGAQVHVRVCMSKRAAYALGCGKCLPATGSLRGLYVLVGVRVPSTNHQNAHTVISCNIQTAKENPGHPWTIGVSQTPPCHSAAAHVDPFDYGILSTTHASPIIVLFVLQLLYYSCSRCAILVYGGLAHLVKTRR